MSYLPAAGFNTQFQITWGGSGSLTHAEDLNGVPGFGPGPAKPMIGFGADRRSLSLSPSYSLTDALTCSFVLSLMNRFF